MQGSDQKKGGIAEGKGESRQRAKAEDSTAKTSYKDKLATRSAVRRGKKFKKK